MHFSLITLFVLAVNPLFSESKLLFPANLYGIPFADKQGIVLNVKEVPIRGIEAPYNAALTKDEKGNYLLFFRYDVKEKKAFKYNYIACSELNKKLDQKSGFQNVDTQSHYSNDPRILKAGSKFFLLYNDTISTDPQNRIMKIAEMNMSNYQLNHITALDRQMQKTEKNWIPFSYSFKTLENLCFIYTIQPYDVLMLEDPRSDRLKRVTVDSSSVSFPWEWGIPRGGTPAELVDGEYLTFFHSSFRDPAGKRWYVMGAFTFEAAPPFKITAASPHPILFESIYSSPHLNGASKGLRCIFPSGLVVTENNRQILVSCGENDSTVKIITFDKEALIKSLIPIKSPAN